MVCSPVKDLSIGAVVRDILTKISIKSVKISQKSTFCMKRCSVVHHRMGTPHMKMGSDVHQHVGTPHMKMGSDVHHRVGTPYMKMWSNVLTGVGTPHNFRDNLGRWVGGWLSRCKIMLLRGSIMQD